MRNLRKVLSLVLCLAVMLSVMVVGAGAAFSDAKDIDTKHQEAVDACVALNIINGRGDGSFDPKATVTREEMCKMICVLLNGGQDPVLGESGSTFADVPNYWAAPYIESCYSRGIVAGTGNNMFSPKSQLTGTQAARMLLVALGFNQDKQGYVGSSWAINVNVDASNRGFYADLEDIDPSAPLSREHAAEMIWNALNAYEVEYKTTLTAVGGELTSMSILQDRVVGNTNDKITLLEDTYNAVTTNAILTSVSYDSDDGTYTTVAGGTYDASKDYSELMGQKVKVMTAFNHKSNDTVLLGIYPVTDNKIVSGLIDDIDDWDTKIAPSKTVTIDSKDYDLSAALKVVALNGKAFNAADLKAYFKYTLIDNNKDDEYEYLVVEPLSLAQIDILTSSKLTMGKLANSLNPKDGWSYDLDDVNLYAGAAEDDYVIVADAQYTVSGDTEITKADIVSGEVTSVKGDPATDARVDGKWYSVAEPTDTGDKINLNDAYDFALVNGFAFNADKTKGNISASNVLYVKDAAALSSGLADGFEAKVYFADGSSQTVIVTEYNDIALTGGDDYDVVKGAGVNAADEEVGAATAAPDAIGKLCTFSQKNGEYSLETVSDNNKGSYDNYLNVAGQIKDGKIAGNRFQSDGVIFVKDDDGMKVITGKTVTNWKQINALSVKGLADKSNGTSYFAIAAIDLGSGVAKTDARTYGFVTSYDGISKEDGTEYRNFTMWDGTQSVAVKVENKGVAATVNKDRFVAFDWADQSAGEADKDDFIVVKAADATAYAAGTNYAAGVAITAFVEGDTITFKDGANAVTTLDFADTYFVIGVDTNAREGSSGKLATAKDAVKDTSLYRNAVVFVVKDGSDDVVEAVFVDVNGSLYDSKDGAEVSYVNK